MIMASLPELDVFLDSWQQDPLGAKAHFQNFLEIFADDPRFTKKFVSRPGISHSLRIFAPQREDGTSIAALIDVVDDEPENRWLSVCFFAHVVTDPEEKGDFVPKGLEDRDAICFNLDEDDAALAEYIAERLREAARS